MIPSLWGALASARAAPSAAGRPALFLLLVTAFVLRLGLAWLVPGIHQADEVYQVAEQATHALRGYGVVSWEFQTASRPALLAASVVPIYLLNVSAASHQILVAALFSALSLIPVWVAFQWVGRLYGRRAGLLAGILMATWFELVYFGPRPTADAVGAYLFLWAIFLGRPGARTHEVFIAAFALMLALVVRMQIAPAILVAAVLIAVVHVRTRALALGGGAIAGLALAGAIEWIWWGAPFRGHWGYLAMEFTHHVSDAFGRQPLTFFAKHWVLFYGGALPVMAALAWTGARKAPVLLLAWIALVVPFHFIGHKEYRFVVSAVPLMVLLMGIGAAGALARVCTSLSVRTLAVATGGWVAAMIAMSLGDAYRPVVFRDRNHVIAFREIGQQSDACGVALAGIRWAHTPGYSGLGRNLPIYEATDPGAVSRVLAAANYVLAAPKVPPPSSEYLAWRTYSRPVQTVYRRGGGCVPDPAAQVRRPPVPASAE